MRSDIARQDCRRERGPVRRGNLVLAQAISSLGERLIGERQD
jgi:hypothetical protein